MTKDVLIKISGLQMMDEESDNIEVITAGQYFLKNGKHYVIYDEEIEGFEGTVHSTIRITPELLDIRKTGTVETHMVFSLDNKDMTHYATPLGEMVIETTTNRISMEADEDSLQVKVEYSLDINYEHVSDCSIVLDVCSREKASLGIW
jgi:uncharacterized beta-barrel protein YwiB (DUF1934 family)